MDGAMCVFLVHRAVSNITPPPPLISYFLVIFGEKPAQKTVLP